MLGVGMRNEQENVDAWDMGRENKTDGGVGAIVHIGEGKNGRDPEASKSTTESTGLDDGRFSVGGWER
jgi:hypothetical protein